MTGRFVGPRPADLANPYAALWKSSIWRIQLVNGFQLALFWSTTLSLKKAGEGCRAEASQSDAEAGLGSAGHPVRDVRVAAEADLQSQMRFGQPLRNPPPFSLGRVAEPADDRAFGLASCGVINTPHARDASPAASGRGASRVPTLSSLGAACARPRRHHESREQAIVKRRPAVNRS